MENTDKIDKKQLEGVEFIDFSKNLQTYITNMTTSRDCSSAGRATAF